MSIESQLNASIEHAKKGNIDEAERNCKEILKDHPDHADTLSFLGELYTGIGNYDAALTCLRKALAQNQSDEFIYYNLANSLRELGEMDEAILHYRKALELNPEFEDAYYNLGIALREKNDIDGAIRSFRKAYELKPDSSDVLNNLGIAFLQKKEFDEAIMNFRKSLQVSPNYTLALNNLGLALYEKGEQDDALRTFQKVIDLDPDFASAYFNLGLVFMKKQDFERAIGSFQAAIKKDSNFEDAYYNAGIAFAQVGRTDDAIDFYRQTLQLNPYRPDVYNNLAMAYEDIGDVQGAITYFKKALELNPGDAEIHWNLSLALLLSGNFQEGWKEYQWRFRVNDFRMKRFKQPQWDGSDISEKTILLHSEQGFGDTIQFIRYASLVAERGARVIVQSPIELASLLRVVEGISSVVALGEELPEFDIHCPLLSLPLIFQTTPDTIPAKTPYIIPDPLLVHKWENTMPTEEAQIRIGLVWAGGPKHKNDRKRSLYLKDFAPLAEFADIKFYSMQKGKAAIETRKLPEVIRLIDYTDEIRDFSDTAALMKNLDLIISVDTAVAHLAGAIGRPVWTLLPFTPDWRWMLDREDSPWYPTMRLLRQPSPGDWESVIQQIKMALKDFIRSKKSYYQ